MEFEFLFFEFNRLVLFSLLICGVISLLLNIYKNNQWIKCQKQRRKLRKQGIKGPSPSFLYGNVPEMQKLQAMVANNNKNSSNGEIVGHDYTSILFPYFEHWRKQYEIEASVFVAFGWLVLLQDSGEHMAELIVAEFPTKAAALPPRRDTIMATFAGAPPGALRNPRVSARETSETFGTKPISISEEIIRREVVVWPLASPKSLSLSWQKLELNNFCTVSIVNELVTLVDSRGKIGR